MPVMSACPSCGRPKVEAVFCACKPPVRLKPNYSTDVDPDLVRMAKDEDSVWFRQYADKADNRSRETQ